MSMPAELMYEPDGDHIKVHSMLTHGRLPGLGEDDHTQYLLIDGTRAMTGDLEISKIAPGITFTDLGNAAADEDWTIGASGDDFIIQNIDSAINGFLDLDHIIRIRQNPRMPPPNFTPEFAMSHAPTLSITGGAVQGYFLINDNPTITLGGAYNSYGIITAIGTATCTTTNALEAVYLFVMNMDITGTTGNYPPSVHSFESKPRIFAATGIFPGAMPECNGFNDWTNIVSEGTGTITITNWITVSATAFDPFYYRVQTDNAAGSVTVTNRIGFKMGEVTKAGGGGTETIQNYYGILFEPFTNGTTLACGIWLGKQANATSNYGIVIDGDGVGADLVLGDGQDMKMYYTGAVGYLDTSIVAASDLQIACGTDKTIELVETVWDDLRVDTLRGTIGASNPPSLAQWRDDGAGSVGVFVYAFGNEIEANEEQIYFAVQLPHKYKQGTDIKAHIHWGIKTAGAANEFVKWGLEYTWANIDAIFPTTTIITSDASSASTATSSGDTTLLINKHYYTNIGTITGTGKNISSMLICRLFRNSSHADDDLAQDAYSFEVDFHFEIDTIGSRQETVK